MRVIKEKFRGIRGGIVKNVLLVQTSGLLEEFSVILEEMEQKMEVF